ncbi:MAG: hypothetical protein ACLFTI_05010, partial [Anaerolineales bacterium]
MRSADGATLISFWLYLLYLLYPLYPLIDLCAISECDTMNVLKRNHPSSKKQKTQGDMMRENVRIHPTADV